MNHSAADSNENDTNSQDTRTSAKRNFSASSGESAEQYLSQLLTKKPKLAIEDDLSDDEEPDDQIRTAGNIKRLTLKNFMCHDHFELIFISQMNFIIGRNGSGKSAVLTGISVGLGAKATDTNRGSATKSLIKDGKSMAKIVVEISNDGINAYEPGIYGKSIIVERKLTRDSQNSYFIKSEDGVTVSNKKKTLDDILQRFSIVVNNPLSFLSQDKAREFIASSTEQSRFAYFAEGTNIRSIIFNYQEASQNIKSLKNRSEAAKSYYKEACDRYLKAESVYKKYKQSNTLRQQMERIHGKIYWYNFEVLEKQIQKKELQISEKTEEIKNIEKQIHDEKALIDLEKEKAESCRAQKLDIQVEFETKSEDFVKAESVHEEAVAELSRLTSDLRTYKSEMEDYTRQIEKHQEDLKSEQKKIDDANGGSKQELTKKLELLKRHQEKLTETKETLQKQMAETSGISPKMSSLIKEHTEIRSTISSLREKIASIEKSKNDRFAAFGASAGKLVRDIDRDSSWHRKPIGPVGCFVSVKEGFDKWADLINSTLSRTLDSYVVSDEHDRNLLKEHMRNNRAWKSIIVRKYEKFNFNNSLSARYSTMLDALEFQNEDARYSLIDSTGLEEFVLCESLPEAEEVTRDRSVKQAFCLRDRKSGTKIGRPNGQLSRDPVYYSRDIRKLAGKVSSDSSSSELKDATKQESLIQEQKRKLQAEEKQIKQRLAIELDQNKQSMKTIANSIFKADKSLREEGDYGRIENLNQQIEQCQNQFTTREGMSIKLYQTRKQSKNDLQLLKSKFEEAKQARNAVAEKLAQVDAEIARHLDEAQRLIGTIGAAASKKNDIVISIDSLQQKLLEGNQKREEVRNTAQERCDRSEVEIKEDDTAQTIAAEFRRIQKSIDDMEKQHEKPFEEVQKEVLSTKALKEKCEKTVFEMENARVNLENDLNARFDNLNITIHEKLGRAKRSFGQCLALRGFKGKLDFDFKKKKVITEVQTEDDKETRAVSSLSGGEKSFTQIAFLLSIWKVMTPRVCGLDEFDVFMDSVNRTIAIKLLIHELRCSSAQSIFITPQDIAVVGDLQDSEDVKIHRISPPRSD